MVSVNEVMLKQIVNQKSLNEIIFRRKIAKTLSEPPYSHKVYFHENPNEFNIRGAKGWVDLYVQTNPGWLHHNLFPVLGIETKIAKKMNWLVEAVEQVGRYSSNLANAKYEIAGKQVPPPTIFLVVTPESWSEGFLYKWTPPELACYSDDKLHKMWSDAAHYGCWFALTTLYERLLMKNGATLIRMGSFFTNMFGRNGAVTRYDLRTYAEGL